MRLRRRRRGGGQRLRVDLSAAAGWISVRSPPKDRYHARVLRTPREVREALAYVLLNRTRHLAHRGIRLVRPGPDAFSSAALFDGWREAVRGPPVAAEERGCVARAQSWLLRAGWRRHGLIGLGEVPGAPPSARRRGEGGGMNAELARAFLDLFEAGRVFGLFLSSAIQGGAALTMDRMLAKGELLRRRYGYRGYLHLKMIPGSRRDQIDEAMALATRVSVNMEAPTAAPLRSIAPSKRFESDILSPMLQVARAEADGVFRRSGQTTQLVVGAADETDREIVAATSWLYRDLRLARVYYSALQPLPDGPLAGRAPVPLVREHRLYEADFLLRSYGFELDDIGFDERGFLPLDVDPKSAWAARHPELFPVEIERATEAELVRVPGIGPRSAKRLVAMRRRERLDGLDALRAAGARWRIAAPYVLVGGRVAARQLSLFG